MALSFPDFKDKYRGKKVDFHSYSSGGKDQCVDIVNFYLTEVWGVSAIIGTDAVNFPSKIKSPLEFVQETPDTIPEVGWVVVFKKYTGLYGDPGHIGIVDEKTDINNLYVFEQNFPTGSVCMTNRHNYRGVVGYIRTVPSNQESMSEDKQLQDCLADRSKFWKERDEAREEAKRLANLLAGVNQVLDSERTLYNSYRETLAKNLDCENTWEAIITKSASVATLEEQKQALEDKLDREEKQHDQERDQLLEEIDQLKADLTQMKADHAKEVEVLVKRLEVIEKKAEQQEEKQQQFDVLRSFIEAVTKVFKK